MIPVHGHCEKKFEALQAAFQKNLDSGADKGAGLAIYHRGKRVVNLWGGMANERTQMPWQENTLVNVFSCTKGITAICAHRLVDEGLLDLEKPVSFYWPEFTGYGKENFPVSYLLCHKAGLSGVRKILPPEALYQWHSMCQALAEEEPWWPGGTAHGYHAVTFGWLVGEVIRRVSGKSVGQYFKETFATPLNLDFHIGLPESEHGRVAHVKPKAQIGNMSAETGSFIQQMLKDPEGISARAFANPFNIATDTNKKIWREAEIPSANGHSTADAMAKIYGALANGGEIDGIPVLSEAAIRRCYTEQARGLDKVLNINTRFSLGFMLSQDDQENASFGPNAKAFGHPGAGGSLGFADPESEIGFAYTINQMGSHILIDPRATQLIKVLYQCLEAN